LERRPIGQISTLLVGLLVVNFPFRVFAVGKLSISHNDCSKENTPKEAEILEF